MSLQTTSSPGKIILSGEHAVVYGHPALLAAVNKTLSITALDDRLLHTIYKSIDNLQSTDSLPYIFNQQFIHKHKLTIQSNIPIGCGMGSSAAYSTALSMLIYSSDKHEIEDKVERLSYLFEKQKHNNSSGADTAVCQRGGFLWYRKESENFKIFKSLTPNSSFPKFSILNTGTPKESTGDMVNLVSEKYKIKKSQTHKLLNNIADTTKCFLEFFLGNKKYQIKELIRENEILLEKLGVVSTSTASLIRQIEKIGGVAKICGAGGFKGDSGILLCYHTDLEIIKEFAQSHNISLLKGIKLGMPGARITNN
ncbi:hypothetical protein IPM62_05220 [Candidatus Woesebacteria bacterium]|nr:MAG: hypothetical protein IPM62_05220 [Candidatus Woesebacteria bacterium]